MQRAILVGCLCTAIATTYACGDIDMTSLQTSSKMTAASPLSASKKSVSGNPFTDAVQYIDGDYVTSVANAAAQLKKSNPHLERVVKKHGNFPTAFWLDSRAAINGSEGRSSLKAHLDGAVAESHKAKSPVVVTLVVYDLPDRDCAALASNGELEGTAGLATYKSEFIDAIYKVFTSDSAYNNLRLALIIEPDSLPNLVTNKNLPNCAAAASDNIYIGGVTYAIQKLGSLPNTFLYLDIGHSAWLGWPNNMDQAVPLYTQVVSDAGNGDLSVIRGFVTNTANYTPLVEPFVNPNNTSLMDGNFYQWNPIFDESTYVKTLASNFSAAGFKNMGFITDTGRNGWPIQNDGQPIDKRKLRGNWCNVKGSGIGVRPTANPDIYPLYDAFVFVKPPGQSDGASTPGVPGYDPNCDSVATPTVDAMSGAPRAGNWFQAQYVSLINLATPGF